MDKLKVGDLVRWCAFETTEAHRGIVVQVITSQRYRIRWFTDGDEVGNHWVNDLAKLEVRGHEI